MELHIILTHFIEINWKLHIILTNFIEICTEARKSMLSHVLQV